MPRFKLTIEYDGTGLAGWQRQNDAITVQGCIEQAAQKLTGVFQGLVVAGRTDAGVHATAQVAHIDIERNIEPYNVKNGINYYLSPISEQIIINHVEAVGDDFHARFSATQRYYFYRIINRKTRLALDKNRAWQIHEILDAQAMQKAAQLLVGTHDFNSFRSTMCQANSSIRTLEKLNVERFGDEIHIHTNARSFLHNQVRNMVGSLRLIGNGKWNEQDLLNAIAAQDRKAGGETAPPEGLYLVGVSY